MILAKHVVFFLQRKVLRWLARTISPTSKLVSLSARFRFRRVPCVRVSSATCVGGGLWRTGWSIRVDSVLILLRNVMVRCVVIWVRPAEIHNDVMCCLKREPPLILVQLDRHVTVCMAFPGACVLYNSRWCSVKRAQNSVSKRVSRREMRDVSFDYM